MRFAKFVLPAWVASGLLAVSAATADDTSLPSRLDPSLYGQLAQNGATVSNRSRIADARGLWVP